MRLVATFSSRSLPGPPVLPLGRLMWVTKSAQDPRFCHLESSCGVQNAAPANIKYRTRQSVSDCQVKVLDICWAFGVKIHPRNYQIYEPGTQRAPKVAVKTCIQLLCVFFIHAPSPTKCDETQFESFISRPL